MNVCLSMMCKNESAVIRETLRSVKPFINSWSILDTGSTDGTQDIILEEMKDILGALFEDGWKGWDRSRTQCIQIAQQSGADFIFVLDADERVLGGKLPELDPAKVYNVRVKYGDGGMVYSRPNILPAKFPWHYVGVTHEYLTADPQFPPTVQLDMVIQTRVKDTVERYHEDIRLLGEEFAKNPNDARTVFYLAQSYKDAGDPEKAIQFYELRAQMGGWDEEVYISLLRIAQLKAHRRTLPEVVAAYVRAHQFRPSRAGETLSYLADFCQWWADGTVQPDDKLFVQTDRYHLKPAP